MPFPRSVSPSQEIVSRPRIVKRDDIKRVQIRRGKPQPAGTAVPYSPEDYWNGYHLSFISQRNSHGMMDDSKYPTEVTGQMLRKKAVPMERNLTPSRQGSDLILRVD
ncbi:uncharacterized protein ATNIH1004_007786 [Aspergillus tanneri]|nr:uncharacterized protein ATNIH1004_007786 [Aspergillus tanneri]KAA8646358.1 hypothetical protein ATNIH1004_007786 [Aspergillus tanneri]